MLLDGDLSKWELRAYALAVGTTAVLLKFLGRRITAWLDSLLENIEADHIRLGQHEEDLVNHVRKGKKYPLLTKKKPGDGE